MVKSKPKKSLADKIAEKEVSILRDQNTKFVINKLLFISGKTLRRVTTKIGGRECFDARREITSSETSRRS